MNVQSMEVRLKYSQGMLYLCQTQAADWNRIAAELGKLYMVSKDQGIPQESQVGNAPPNIPNAPVAEDPERVRFRMRIAHLIRGAIFIYALGMPRVFYYVFGMYAMMTMSGLLDRLTSVEFRRYWTGSRPTLDLQLVRLRQRKQYIDSLDTSTLEEYEKMREFLSTFRQERPYYQRFVYQLFVMLFYSALPSCHPHPQFMT